MKILDYHILSCHNLLLHSRRNHLSAEVVTIIPQKKSRHKPIGFVPFFYVA